MTASRGELEAETIIRKAYADGTKELDLSALRLTELPRDVGQLYWIKVLKLSNNLLESVPQEIRRLNDLEVIDLNNNHFVEFPEPILNFRKLTQLHLNGNRIEEIPMTIANLSSLTRLDLTANRLKKLPDTFNLLRNMQELGLGGNLLDKWPMQLSLLPNLRELYLWGQSFNMPDDIGAFSHLKLLSWSNSMLTALPRSLCQLSELEELLLNDNQLTTLPEAIGQLKKLQTLELRSNALASLPSSIRALRALATLDLRGNDSLDIPPEILEGTVDDILQFYFAKKSQPTRRLGEAKILIVGQAGTGKSSLVRRLVDNSFDSHNSMTEGIAINKCVLHRSETTSERSLFRQGLDYSSHLDDNSIRVNIWDFGGQEIMHATHQFFLTKRSLYLLVLDARKSENDGNLHYWLKMIQSYGGDSPIIIIINKSEPPHYLDLNENRLKLDYAPNLIAFARVSCSTGQGIRELHHLIAAQIAAIPHVDDRVPASYFIVKEQLELNADDYIDYAAYERICLENGLENQRDREVLLRFLHDLGSVLNFNDRESPYRLRDTNVLKPEWVTRGVYDILLKSRTYMQEDGIFNLIHMKELLDSKRYPADKHEFIIGMMMAFELCYEVSAQRGQLLIPEQLSRNEPYFDWPTIEALNFQYHYNVLPEGIILRFMVRMRDYFPQRPTCWRSGVVVEIEGCKALVRSDSQAGRMYISVLGKGFSRRRALAVIRAKFREIHISIPRIQVQEKVPLPGQPHIVGDYKHLLKLEEIGDTEYLPEGASNKVNVADLLEGVETMEERSQRRGRESEGLQSSPNSGVPSTPAPRSDDSGDRLHHRWRATGQLIAAGFFGVMFLLLMLIVATAIPNPTDFQINVFRVILAVTAGAFGAIVPGFLELEIKHNQVLWLRAGGALALFLIIYWWNPPTLAKQHSMPQPASPASIQPKT